MVYDISGMRYEADRGIDDLKRWDFLIGRNSLYFILFIMLLSISSM